MKRTILADILSRKPVKPLYHYTTQKGLLGIVGEKKIWATHTQFLNDCREYLHAVDMVREEIKALLTEHHDVASQEILGEMDAGLDGIESINVCVSSFSEDGDSLSQWRAYGTETSGFAIGFPGDFITAVAEKKQWYLAPCIYDRSEQRTVIRALVEEVFDQNVERKNKGDGEENDLPPGGNLCAYLHRYAPILKDSSFEGEREWRVISRPLSCKSELFDFREGSSMLIPYYKLPLAYDELMLRIHEIVIGPTPHQQQSKMSVTGFLIRQGLRDVPVIVSRVPYRNW